MKLIPCLREPEIRSLLDRGHWPAAASSDLTTHAASCTRCAQLVLLTQAFRQDSARASAAAGRRLEAPGVLWWRAQLRRRNSDLARLRRPLIGAQVFSVALSLIAASAFLVWESLQTPSWLADIPRVLHIESLQTPGWLAGIPRALHFESLLPAPLQTPLGLTALLAGALTLIVAVGKALDYATSDTRD